MPQLDVYLTFNGNCADAICPIFFSGFYSDPKLSS